MLFRSLQQPDKPHLRLEKLERTYELSREKGKTSVFSRLSHSQQEETAASSILIELSRTVTCEENGVSTQSLDTLNSTDEIHRHTSWQLCRGFTCRHNVRSGRTLIEKALSKML